VSEGRAAAPIGAIKGLGDFPQQAKTDDFRKGENRLWGLLGIACQNFTTSYYPLQFMLSFNH